jgi:hypothetical protein
VSNLCAPATIQLCKLLRLQQNTWPTRTGEIEVEKVPAEGNLLGDAGDVIVRQVQVLQVDQLAHVRGHGGDLIVVELEGQEGVLEGEKRAGDAGEAVVLREQVSKGGKERENE